MKRQPWLRRKKTAPELPVEPPIRLGNMSNGEFFHDSTPHEQRVRHEILRQADEKARKLGVDRREFLASAAHGDFAHVLNLSAAAPETAAIRGGFVDMACSDGSPAGGLQRVRHRTTRRWTRACDDGSRQGGVIFDCNAHLP